MPLVSGYACPACGHDAFEVWTSIVPLSGEILVCEDCGHELRRDQLASLKPPSKASRSSKAASKGKAKQEIVPAAKKKGRKKAAQQQAETKPAASKKAKSSKKKQSAPETTPEQLEAAKLLVEEFPENVAVDDYGHVCLASPKQRYLSFKSHDLTSFFEMPARCVVTGEAAPAETLKVAGKNKKPVLSVTFPLAKDAESLKDAVSFDLDEGDNVLVFSFANLSFFAEFVRANADDLAPLPESFFEG